MRLAYLFAEGWPLTSRIKYAGVSKRERESERKEEKIREEREEEGERRVVIRWGKVLALLTISRGNEGGRKDSR